MSDKPKPFDRYPKDHPLFGRLFQFEGEWLEELKDQAEYVSPKDLAMFNAGFRRGIANKTPGEHTQKMLDYWNDLALCSCDQWDKEFIDMVENFFSEYGRKIGY